MRFRTQQTLLGQYRDNLLSKTNEYKLLQ